MQLNIVSFVILCFVLLIVISSMFRVEKRWMRTILFYIGLAAFICVAGGIWGIFCEQPARRRWSQDSSRTQVQYAGMRLRRHGCCDYVPRALHVRQPVLALRISCLSNFSGSVNHVTRASNKTVQRLRMSDVSLMPDDGHIG